MTTETASQLFARLERKAQLSNKVSADALKKGALAWSAYAKKPNHQRDLNAPRIVLSQVHLIVRQITHRECRIDPTEWATLCKLYNLLSDAVRTGVILEPIIQTKDKWKVA